MNFRKTQTSARFVAMAIPKILSGFAEREMPTMQKRTMCVAYTAGVEPPPYGAEAYNVRYIIIFNFQASSHSSSSSKNPLRMMAFCSSFSGSKSAYFKLSLAVDEQSCNVLG